MPILPESWQPIAETLGYKSEREMLEDLYVTQGFSIQDLAVKLGYARNNIRRRLLIHGFELRSRGGKNNRGDGKLAELPDEKMRENPFTLAKEFGVHPATVFRERRKRGIKCISRLLRRQSTSTGSVGEENTSSALHPLQPEMQDILSGIEEELRRVMLSSSTTEPTKESVVTNKNSSRLTTLSDPE